MAEIFCNGKVIALNGSTPMSEAFFVGGENIVFVGLNSDVKSLKTKAVKEINLNGNYVLPAMFNFNFSLLNELCKNEKTANSLSFGTNYDLEQGKILKDCDFSKVKKLWQDKQKEFLKSGITTIWAMINSESEFKFWQKLSDENLIKIDVIGVVNYRVCKTVMDENCRSYRKYKNGFRLGGYKVTLDGKIYERKAWLNKPYKHLSRFAGYGEIVDEELVHIIRTALEEKKQLIIEANGDRAVDQVISCYDIATDNKEVEDNYKLMIETSGLISNQQLINLQAREIGIKVNFLEIKNNFETIKKFIGTKRAKQLLNFSDLLKSDLKVLLDGENLNIFELLGQLKGDGETKFAKVIKKQNLNVNKLLECVINNAAYYSFEDSQKGSLESGKKANFVVLDGAPFSSKSEPLIFQTFINSKKVFHNKK